MRSVSELRGRAVPHYQEWGDLDLNYRVVADINPDTCIGCQLCYVACMDGSHQCIHLPGRTQAQSRAAGHLHLPDVIPLRVLNSVPGSTQARVPYVDEPECVGCNLCALICPVEGCITMKEVPSGKPPQSWNDRVAAGQDFVPGGLESTVRRTPS